MLSLAESLPGTRIRIFSGLEPGGVKRALLLAATAAAEAEKEPSPGSRIQGVGTVIVAAASTAEPVGT